MKRIERTAVLKDAEQKYWQAYHIVEVSIADPLATHADRQDCLKELKSAHDAWVAEIQRQHLKQHKARPSVADVRDHLVDVITNVLNARNFAQEGR